MQIHGTMYWKTWTLDAESAVRYIVVDPQLRSQTAARFQLEPRIVKELERMILPNNPYMKAITKLAIPRRGIQDVPLRLDWDE
eukprot:4022269-Pyramimonas_sp.AAC.1